MSVHEWDYDDLCAAPLKFRGMTFISKDDHVAALAEAERLRDASPREQIGYVKGRAEALREAREAVAPVQPWNPAQETMLAVALAAIDALITKGASDDVGTR